MIHLIVGNTGAGKTTYSNKLKTETDGLNWFLERIERAESVIMDLIIQLENSETDSILDLGLSKQEHREKFRKFARIHGFQTKLHFLDISKEIRRNRIRKRNSEKGETFQFEVTEENFNFMENWFEPPTHTEMENGLLIVE